MSHQKKYSQKAQQGGYAVGAFNAENMEMVKAIIQAAEEVKAPVMIRLRRLQSNMEQLKHMQMFSGCRGSQSKRSGMSSSGSWRQF